MRRNVSAPALWPAVRGRPRFVGPATVAVHDDRNVAGRDQGLVHRTVDTLWHDKFSHFKMDCWGDLSHWTGNAAMMMAGPFSPPLSSSQSPLNTVSACGKTAPLLSPLCKIRRGRCETMPVYLRETDENRGCKTAFDQLLFPPVPLYPQAVRRVCKAAEPPKTAQLLRTGRALWQETQVFTG